MPTSRPSFALRFSLRTLFSAVFLAAIGAWAWQWPYAVEVEREFDVEIPYPVLKSPASWARYSRAAISAGITNDAGGNFLVTPCRMGLQPFSDRDGHRIAEELELRHVARPLRRMVDGRPVGLRGSFHRGMRNGPWTDRHVVFPLRRFLGCRVFELQGYESRHAFGDVDLQVEFENGRIVQLMRSYRTAPTGSEDKLVVEWNADVSPRAYKHFLEGADGTKLLEEIEYSGMYLAVVLAVGIRRDSRSMSDAGGMASRRANGVTIRLMERPHPIPFRERSPVR